MKGGAVLEDAGNDSRWFSLDEEFREKWKTCGVDKESCKEIKFAMEI